ncbi:MAG: AmmeMemoRadiSam system radical SAM enzyme [Elusimicrobia bacterium]|nr:AmmeMemoRadiSam system radical SAM enzyme [Elusimicrobiota bacterium]
MADILLTRRQLLGRAIGAASGLAAAGAAAGAAGWAAWLVRKRRPPRTFGDPAPPANPHVREAAYWKTACLGVQCELCPFQCFLPEGGRGLCRVRMNTGGRLMTLVHSHPVSVHIDPIEKKPVFHLLPGSLIYSLAAAGCNLRCSFCQNWEISQAFPEEADRKAVIPRELRILSVYGGMAQARVVSDEAGTLPPEEVVKAARATHCKSIAYTYSEPVVFYEYVRDVAALAKKAGLRNVMVTAGYINPKPLAELAPLFDVIKVDLKGFDEGFYRRMVGGELRFVLRTLVELRRLKAFCEVVNLVVPTLNDDPAQIKEMCAWVAANMGADTPVFFSRFHPQYKAQNIPPTPVETLTLARDLGMKAGLRYVYVGNVPGHPGENTYCPKCKAVMVRRQGYAILENRISPGGRCPNDGTRIPGIWG